MTAIFSKDYQDVFDGIFCMSEGMIKMIRDQQQLDCDYGNSTTVKLSDGSIVEIEVKVKPKNSKP